MIKPESISWQDVYNEVARTTTEVDREHKMICPYCGSELDYGDEYFGTDCDDDYDLYSCTVCGKEFDVRKMVDVKYVCTKLAENVMEELTEKKNIVNRKVK